MLAAATRKSGSLSGTEWTFLLTCVPATDCAHSRHHTPTLTGGAHLAVSATVSLITHAVVLHLCVVRIILLLVGVLARPLRLVGVHLLWLFAFVAWLIGLCWLVGVAWLVVVRLMVVIALVIRLGVESLVLLAKQPSGWCLPVSKVGLGVILLGWLVAVRVLVGLLVRGRLCVGLVAVLLLAGVLLVGIVGVLRLSSGLGVLRLVAGGVGANVGAGRRLVAAVQPLHVSHSAEQTNTGTGIFWQDTKVLQHSIVWCSHSISRQYRLHATMARPVVQSCEGSFLRRQTAHTH